MSRAELKTAGATIRHESPFSALPVPPPPSRDVTILDWQRGALHFEPCTIAALQSGDIMSVDVDSVRDLLCVFNWRHRKLGGYLAAIRGFQSLESLIGTLLLRSDVCYAGQAYCLALARFNSSASVGYLTDYLSHYLTRPDLYFQQQDAFAALVLLDRMNLTAHASSFEAMWSVYAEGECPAAWLEARVDLYTRMLATLDSFTPPACEP